MKVVRTGREFKAPRVARSIDVISEESSLCRPRSSVEQLSLLLGGVLVQRIELIYRLSGQHLRIEARTLISLLISKVFFAVSMMQCMIEEGRTPTSMDDGAVGHRRQ